MAERRQAAKDESGKRPGARTQDQEESRRILERMERESSAMETMVQRGFSRTASHLSAHDADKADPVEVWATRIGRVLGLFITLAIIVWLVTYLLQG